MHSGHLAVQDLRWALDHFHSAREVLDREADKMPRGLVYCGLAMAYLDRLELDDAVSWAQQAIDLGESRQFPAVAANAYAPLGSAVALGDATAGRESLEQAWQIASQSRLGFQADLARAHGARTIGVSLKDPKAGLDWVERGPDNYTTYSLFDIPSHLVALHALKGQFDKASQIVEELQRRLRLLSQPLFGLWPDELGMLWIRMGEWTKAEALLMEAFDWAVAGENRMAEVSVAQKLGELFLALGKFDEAERYLFHVRDQVNGIGSSLHQLSLLPHLCELYLRTSRLQTAIEYLRSVDEMIDSSPDWGGLNGDRHLAHGLVEAASGSQDEAERAFADASCLRVL